MCKKVYNIKIEYTTGGSFGREDAVTNLDVLVTSIDTAKDNLKAIAEHYHSNKDIYINDLTLKTDHGTITIYPFWIGYFETLHKASIIEEDDDELVIEF